MHATSRLAQVIVASIAISAGCGGGGARPAATAPTPPADAADHASHAGHAGHHGHHADGVDHDFVDAAAWAKVFDDPARDAWQKPEEVIALLQALPGQVIADIGAGTGYFERYLSRAVGASGVVYALDTEATMVAYMEERARREAWPNVVVRQVAPGDPGLPANGVDRILIVDTWHHLPDRAAYAKAIAIALRPGGGVMIVDFTPDAPLGPPPAMRIPAEVVIQELKAAGLTATDFDETLPHQYVVVARKPTGRP
jgi:SAM-dependent methyltransferase